MEISKAEIFSFPTKICPSCGKKTKVMYSNNPLSGNTICFSCINIQLKYDNIQHADFFCRTYNLPFDPNKWIEISKEYKEETFAIYAEYMFTKYDEEKNNLYYKSTTADLWALTNKEWEKNRSLYDILKRIEPIKQSYIERGHLRWGPQYSFEELYRLDDIYTKTLKANAVINPIQKAAIRSLCKVQIEMDKAIEAEDAKAIKDFGNTWATLAKQADLEDMIANTKTDDITTLSELYQYIEDKGYKLRFYDNYDRDEIDVAIKDIQATNRRTILEATGLTSQLQEMIEQKKAQTEQTFSDEVTQDVTLEDLVKANTEINVDTESDEEALAINFNKEE